MKEQPNRREVLTGAAATCAVALLPATQAGAYQTFRAAGRDVEIQIAPVSEYTFRLTIFPIENQAKEIEAIAVPDDGSLVQSSWGAPLANLRASARVPSVKIGEFRVQATPDPMTISIESSKGHTLQQVKVDEVTGVLSFQIGNAPLLGLGEGGAQFDRRGAMDRMRSGQGGYKLETHGGRVPIPWLIGTSGWAMFLHYPYGAFDLTGPEGKFLPTNPDSALPLDLFLVFASEPATIMAEYARITGHPEMPPLWSFGYHQSHRTLESREEIIAEAKTFREKKLPCDALIYLGTGFCPSGWNTENGSFEWNSRVFPDPKEILDELHQEHFHVVLHVVILNRQTSWLGRDKCDMSRFDEAEASCYWDAHRKDFAMGMDGWWPDEGDPLDIASRLDPQSHVLGGRPDGSAQRAALRAASQWLRGDAALRFVSLVWRCLLEMGDFASPHSYRHQHCAHGHSALGNGHRRICAHQRI